MFKIYSVKIKGDNCNRDFKNSSMFIAPIWTELGRNTCCGCWCWPLAPGDTQPLTTLICLSVNRLLPVVAVDIDTLPPGDNSPLPPCLSVRCYLWWVLTLTPCSRKISPPHTLPHPLQSVGITCHGCWHWPLAPQDTPPFSPTLSPLVSL